MHIANRKLLVPVATFAAFPFMLWGCDQPPPPPQKIDGPVASQKAATNTRDIVKTMGDGLGFWNSGDSVLTRGINGAGDSGSGLTRKNAVKEHVMLPLLEDMHALPFLRDLTRPKPAPTFLMESEEFDELATDVSVLLGERILVASNVESKTDTQVTYLLKSDPTCKPLPSKLSRGRAPAVDPECAKNLTALQVRVVQTADGDGSRLQFLVGPARDELVVFVIRSTYLGFETNLASARKATDFANKALATPQDQLPYPLTRLEGRLRAGVEKLGPSKVKASFGVLEAVAVEASKPSFSFTTAKSDPLFTLVGDGATKAITMTVNVGATDVRATWDPKDTGVMNRDLQVSIGGIYGEASLTEASKEINFKGLGVGQTFVAVRGNHIFDMDLNPMDARKFDMKVKVGANDVPRIEIAPKFDLSLGFKLGAIASDFNEAPPSYLLAETYRVQLAAASPPAVIELVEDGIKVVAGALTISTTANSAATITVPSGSCLRSRSMPSVGAHKFLGGFQSVACP